MTFKYHTVVHKDVHVLLVETALAVKIPVCSFSVSLEELGTFGMENVPVYLLQNLNLLFLSPRIPLTLRIQ